MHQVSYSTHAATKLARAQARMPSQTATMHFRPTIPPPKAKKAMESGALVSDEIVVGLIQEAMDK